ncbi:histidine kinase [Chitinophaga pendula]|uniref:sensor histidine kinase n=1 Tax=Chitinophaga TaxID=79328 RepID=UPI000BAFAED5|nr:MULTISPECIES: histidine kinase [Chitinophaga]ASZ12219.1 sensor histidine kinase [Chitinophaga sp. MD30]UCJ04751.1 histidine kinase [Chitinophaga pendula]
MENKTTQERLFNRYYRIFVIPMIFGLYYLLSYLINPFHASWAELSTRKWTDLALEGLIMMAICGMITEFSLISARWMDRLVPWDQWPIRRFIVQLICQVLSVFLALNLIFPIVVFVFGVNLDKPATAAEELDRWQFIFVCLMMSILISAVHTGNFFLRRWKTSMLEAAELKLKTSELQQIAMQAQLQSLKLQLDPHFMFNNFSTLSALIEEDKQTALLFLENLSRVYRYMILNLSNDLISLRDEIRFIQAYIYLMKIRYGDNVDIHIDVPEEATMMGIPPITLQLLMENAIKHNVASPDQPLRIHIFQERPDELIISNNIQRLATPLPSTKLGLENIKNRYRLLSDLPVAVSEDHAQFMVKLPLLEL